MYRRLTNVKLPEHRTTVWSVKANELGPSPTGERAGRRSGAGAVWLREEPERPRRAPLSRERIVDAATNLLDELGIEGLTMRRLAQRLDVTSTALYWHVETKDDVLDLPSIRSSARCSSRTSGTTGGMTCAN